MFDLIKPTPEHMAHVVCNMRIADVEECAAGNVTPTEAIQVGVERSHPCYSIIWNDECIGIGGCHREVSLDTAFIWFLGTPRSIAPDLRRKWLTFAPEVIDLLRGDLRVTSAISVDTNEVHHQWLRMLGYTEQPKLMPNHTIFSKEHFHV